MVTRDGTAKILDFGLATRTSPEAGDTVDFHGAGRSRGGGRDRRLHVAGAGRGPPGGRAIGHLRLRRRRLRAGRRPAALRSRVGRGDAGRDPPRSRRAACRGPSRCASAARAHRRSLPAQGSDSPLPVDGRPEGRARGRPRRPGQAGRLPAAGRPAAPPSAACTPMDAALPAAAALLAAAAAAAGAVAWWRPSVTPPACRASASPSSPSTPASRARRRSPPTARCSPSRRIAAAPATSTSGCSPSPGRADPGDARSRRRPDAGRSPPTADGSIYRSERGGGGIYSVPALGGEPRLIVAGRAGAAPVARRPATRLLDRVVHRLLRRRRKAIAASSSTSPAARRARSPGSPTAASPCGRPTAPG